MPLTLTIRRDVIRSLDSRLEARDAAQGINYEWMREFDAHATGVASTFRPTIVGFAAVLDNLSAFVDNVQRPNAIAATAGVYVVLWTFLAGGVIERYARSQPSISGPGFIRACWQYFGRFLRIEIATAVVYGFLFVGLHRWMFGRLYPHFERHVSLERTAFLIRISFYTLFVVLLATANAVFDFAKIRAVAERRRSAVFALVASCRFLRQNASGAIAVYLLDAITFAALLSMYAYVAPAGGGTGAMAWVAVLIGQAYVVGRLCVRLLYFASETALFQSGHK